jgi:hypothetical protein
MIYYYYSGEAFQNQQGSHDLFAARLLTPKLKSFLNDNADNQSLVAYPAVPGKFKPLIAWNIGSDLSIQTPGGLRHLSSTYSPEIIATLRENIDPFIYLMGIHYDLEKNTKNIVSAIPPSYTAEILQECLNRQRSYESVSINGMHIDRKTLHSLFAQILNKPAENISLKLQLIESDSDIKFKSQAVIEF